MKDIIAAECEFKTISREQADILNQTLNNYIQYYIDIVQHNKELFDSTCLKSIRTQSVLYYIINSENRCKECHHIIDIMDAMNKWIKTSKDNNISIYSIINSCKSNDFKHSKAEESLRMYFVGNEWGYKQHNYYQLLQLLNDISQYVDISKELDLFKRHAKKSYEVKILIIINIIERVIYKIGQYKDNIHRRKIDKQVKLDADMIAKAIISSRVLFCTYDNNNLNGIIIPNRNIIVHESIAIYKDKRTTYNILIDMVYNILYYDYTLYTIFNNITEK